MNWKLRYKNYRKQNIGIEKNIFFWQNEKKVVSLQRFYRLMPEILFHYIWQKRIWSGFPQTTTDGKSIEVVSVGEYNIHAGPDFNHAHIRIDGQDWVGNIEIHVHSSDWYKHRHHLDSAYNSTILHVVAQADKEVQNACGEMVPQCELRYPHHIDYLSQMLQSTEWHASLAGKPDCGKQLSEDPALLSHEWKKTLLKKRLECKQQSIKQLLDITQQSWIHAFYISLAHNFGFHTNSMPFEALALATPLSCLQKHRNSLFQLTAILLGQSGLLEPGARNQEQGLWEEYCFLQKKFSLTPIDASMWKKMRMRPQNTPEVRIRQFAHLIYQSEFLFTQLMEATTTDKMAKLLSLEYGDEEVYTRVQRPLPIGRSSIDILLINTVIPYKYAYAQSKRIEDAIEWLENIKKEDNTIIRQWTTLGQEIHSAADTQALIHLYQHYCQPHRCFNCQVGYQVFGRRQLTLF
jgi:hypothetical protein